MQLLYESIYQVLLFSEKDSMFVSEWKEACNSMDDESHLIEVHKVFSLFRRIKPLRYYCDVRNLSTQSKERQDFAANLFKDHAAHFCAVISNLDPLQIEVQEFIEELKTLSDFTVFKVFKDKCVAMNWLLSCGNDPINLKNSQEAVNHL